MPILDSKIMLFRDMRENENFKIEEIQQARETRENQLIEEILEKAPKVLHWHLKEDLMLKDLLQHGRCSRRIRHKEHDGLETRAKIKTAFENLQKVVGSLLKVSFVTEPQRTEVKLEIAKLTTRREQRTCFGGFSFFYFMKFSDTRVCRWPASRGDRAWRKRLPLS